MKVIGYCRVSTEEQAREGVSLDNQEQKIRTYCELYGHELTEVIVDAGLSAKTINRDGMQRLIEMTAKRKSDIDGIVIYKLDRLFRNAEEALHHTKQWDKKGIALISVVEMLDTKSAMGRFFFTLMAAIAEMERNVIAERTSDALRCKKRNGYKTGGDVPYGFDMEMKDNEKILVPNEHEQKILKQVETMRQKGLTLKAIAEQLEQKMIKTKKGKEKWDPKQISRLLKTVEIDSTTEVS